MLIVTCFTAKITQLDNIRQFLCKKYWNDGKYILHERLNKLIKHFAENVCWFWITPLNASKHTATCFGKWFHNFFFKFYETCIFFHFKTFYKKLSDIVKLCDFLLLSISKSAARIIFTQCYSQIRLLTSQDPDWSGSCLNLFLASAWSIRHLPNFILVVAWLIRHLPDFNLTVAWPIRQCLLFRNSDFLLLNLY